MLMKPLVVLFAVCSLAACKPDITDPFEIDLGPAPTITVVSGQGQVVPLGSEAVVRVRMLRADATPMVNTSVSFLYLETIPNQIGGGTITSRPTDSDGVAELRFTTTRLGPFTVTASYSECARFYISECPEVVLRASATVTGTIVAGS
jgi:hypothetical protein